MRYLTISVLVILLTCISINPVQADALPSVLTLNQDQSTILGQQSVVHAQQEALVIQQTQSIQASVNLIQKTVDQDNALIQLHQTTILNIKEQEEKLTSKRQQETQTLANYLRTDYVQGNTSYINKLSWLLGSQSLDDILNRVSYIESIVDFYKNLRDQIAIDSKKLQENQLSEETTSAQLLQTVQSKQQMLDNLNTALAKQRALIGAMTIVDQETLAVQLQAQDGIYDTQGLVAAQAWEAELASRGISLQEQADLLKAAQSSGRFTNLVESNGTINQLLLFTESFLGSPYVWGGTTPVPGFDCSGLVQYTYASFGVKLPRVTWDQYTEGQSVDKDDLLPGDLVFFSTYEPGPSHVGIYIGNRLMIDDNNRGVSYDSIDYSYWSTKYVGARRVIKQ